MKILNLSIVTQVLNEEGEQLIKKANSKSSKKTSNGLTAEWFSEQGLEPPQELLDEEIERDEDGSIILDEKHLDYEETFCALPIKNIDSWYEHEDIGTIVNMKSGLFFHVFQMVDEITDMIEYLETPFFIKWWIELKILYRRLTNKNNNLIQ